MTCCLPCWLTFEFQMQLVSIAQRRPDSLVGFFQDRVQGKTTPTQDPNLTALAEHLVDALPWVVHSLQTRTGAAELPRSFLQYLVQGCVAALAACAAACHNQSGNITPCCLNWLSNLPTVRKLQTLQHGAHVQMHLHGFHCHESIKCTRQDASSE